MLNNLYLLNIHKYIVFKRSKGWSMWKSLHCWENCVPLNKIQLQLRIARRFYNLSNSHLSVIDQNLIQRFVPEFYIISKLSLQKNQPINLISISNKTNFSKSQLFNYNNSNTL